MMHTAVLLGACILAGSAAGSKDFSPTSRRTPNLAVIASAVDAAGPAPVDKVRSVRTC